ncbi:hypothetical protein [Armatimonas sp.]|uniref:hypothetical protein n=1 Tax=Armatimonas sp. TaxID=1872638 RepID=UPI003751E2E3
MEKTLALKLISEKHNNAIFQNGNEIFYFNDEEMKSLSSFNNMVSHFKIYEKLSSYHIDLSRTSLVGLSTINSSTISTLLINISIDEIRSYCTELIKILPNNDDISLFENLKTPTLRLVSNLINQIPNEQRSKLNKPNGLSVSFLNKNSRKAFDSLLLNYYFGPLLTEARNLLGFIGDGKSVTLSGDVSDLRVLSKIKRRGNLTQVFRSAEPKGKIRELIYDSSSTSFGNILKSTSEIHKVKIDFPEYLNQKCAYYSGLQYAKLDEIIRAVCLFCDLEVHRGINRYSLVKKTINPSGDIITDIRRITPKSLSLSLPYTPRYDAINSITAKYLRNNKIKSIENKSIDILPLYMQCLSANILIKDLYQSLFSTISTIPRFWAEREHVSIRLEVNKYNSLPYFLDIGLNNSRGQKWDSLVSSHVRTISGF